MESYAKSPAYGKETTLSIPLNMTELLAAGEADSTFTNLSLTIFPSRNKARPAGFNYFVTNVLNISYIFRYF